MFGKACSKGFLSILRMSARLTVAIYFVVGVLALATAAQAGLSSLRALPEVLQGAVCGALGLDDLAYHVEKAGESCRGGNPAQRFEATWSDGMASTAAAPVLPGKAALISPSGAITANTPTYAWIAVSNATWYCLWVNDSTGNKINTWYTAAQAGCWSGGGSGTCSVTLDTFLAAGQAKWWIQTWNSAGCGPWSDAMAFQVPVPTPPGKATLQVPSGAINTDTPSFAWQSDAHTTWYYLRVNDSTGTRIQQWYKAVQAGCPGGTGICTVTPDTALATGSAQWWIQTWNPNGFGLWSDDMAFSIGP